MTTLLELDNHRTSNSNSNSNTHEPARKHNACLLRALAVYAAAHSTQLQRTATMVHLLSPCHPVTLSRRHYETSLQSGRAESVYRRAGRLRFGSRQHQQMLLFSAPSSPAVGPTQSAVQWLPGVTRTEREANHSLWWSYTFVTQRVMDAAHAPCSSCCQSLSVMKNGVFWDVTPCGSCNNRRFGGT
jgi:hypothetical protein